MAVSANTLFHFTRSHSLQSILSSMGFFAQYSDEHFENLLPPTSIYRFTYIPLISFCDLTIMQLAGDSQHRKNFDDYGVGLTKEWGIKTGVSPVIYVHNNSQPSNQLYKLIKLFRAYSKKNRESSAISMARKELIDSFKFIKPYKGRWHKGKEIEKDLPDIIYYNEREWRYCPPLENYRVLSGIRAYNKPRKDSHNTLLKQKLIKFTPDDVKYIIIKTKSDISDFVSVIEKMEISPKNKNELITKIITFEELNEDY